MGNDVHIPAEREHAMDPKSRDVLDAALGLPEADRATIAERLLATLAPETDFLADDELAAELDRRLEEAVNEPGATVPWSVLRDEP
jgi:putative addiction module component (TIGR02574 family)